VPEAKPVPPNQWIQQWLTLFNDYPDVKFFKVNPKEGKASQKLNEWKMCKNLTYIKLSELDEHIK
jgi:hypothetical protein